MNNLSAEPAHGFAAPADLTPEPLDTTALEQFGISVLLPYQRLVATNILRAAEGDGYSACHSVNPVTGEVEIEDAVTDQTVILPTGADRTVRTGKRHSPLSKRDQSRSLSLIRKP